MKILLTVLAVAIIVTILFVSYQSFFKNGFQIGTKTAKVTIDGTTFSAEIASTPQEKQIGLSKKTSLGDTEGMIFPFGSPDYYGFWMKDMTIPIDILYIRDNKIVTIFENVPNPTSKNEAIPVYHPTQPADTVLELKSGATEKYHIKQDDMVTIENLK